MRKSDYTSQKALFKNAFRSERAASNGRANSVLSHLRLSVSLAYHEDKPELMMERLYLANNAALRSIISKKKASFQQSQKLRDAFAKRAVGGEL
ncbi:hypothetical protein [Photobacterium sanguinicancri]|uniref:Transposase n=1 Tax=Photobacterium sanguinicancri TaxID=875932 RepID=A0AAW7YBF8_9GAMM|nr:hypothetical protein [Photobacterium sanguinicancri]MDO6545566.1 hypothetical protein [Photobacterium sanguinicancri]